MRLHFVWEAYVGSQGSTHWEIQMCNMYWENEGDFESTIWGGVSAIAVADGVDLRHPSIDAGAPYNDDNEIGSGNAEHVVLTYDCRYRGQGTTTETRFKYLPFLGQSLSPSNYPIGMGDLIFPAQNSYYYPDITIWGYEEDTYPYNWRWETVVVGQKLGIHDNFISAKASINLGATWGLEVNVGSMGTTSPQLRGVAIDSGIGDGDDAINHPGGIYVIWDVDVNEWGVGASEIRSRKLGITPLGVLTLINPITYNVDTTGLYGGDLRYVATSYTVIITIGESDEYYTAYTHNLYNIVVGSSTEPTWSGSVIYYRQP